MSPSQKIRVLVVEDDEQTRYIYSVKLRDFSLECAANGKEGLEKFYSSQPDIIITDLFMPEMDGTELIRNIRLTGSEIPILVVTGAADEDRINQNKALEAGADAALSKPVKKDSLLGAIYRLLKAS